MNRNLQGGNLAVAGLLFASSIGVVANTDNVLTIAAVAGKRILLNRLYISYSGSPTGAKLTITGGSATFDVHIPSANFPMVLDMNYLGTVNTNMVITLLAGGAAIVSKINADYTLE